MVNNAIYSSVSGSLSSLDRLDALTYNLANANTPGFKAQLAVQHASTVASAPASALSAVGTPINTSRLETDFAQGSIEPDGNPLHLALTGPGFFVVDGPGGERLTRRGTFQLDEQGFLVTSEGARVQGDGGDIALGDALNDDTLQIGEDGTILVGDNRLGRVRVVTVADPQQLAREGGSLFAANGQTLTDVDDGISILKQGAIERANVSPVANLVALIETMRGFESYMNATTRLDSVNERAINELARV